MPKVIYTAAKGLYQAAGTGFEINDVVLSPSTESLTAGTDASLVVQTKTAASVAVDGTKEMSISDGTSVGQEAIVAISSAANTPLLTIRNEDDDADIRGQGSVNAGDVIVFVWNGSDWKLLS